MSRKGWLYKLTLTLPNPSPTPNQVSRKGWLYKLARGGRVSWQRRYFALAGSTLFFADDPDVIQVRSGDRGRGRGGVGVGVGVGLGLGLGLGPGLW